MKGAGVEKGIGRKIETETEVQIVVVVVMKTGTGILLKGGKNDHMNLAQIQIGREEIDLEEMRGKEKILIQSSELTKIVGSWT